MEWKEKIAQHDVRVAIIGLGYVGLPLAVQIAKKGFHVVGIDVNTAKVAEINGGTTSLPDVDDAELGALVGDERIRATTDYASVADSDAIVICVPTPLNKTKDPDVSFIVASCTEIAKHLRSEHLVVLESTTYPGFTREIAVPVLERSGLTAGDDFHVAFSPERIDPGNAVHQVHNTTKIVGGLTDECTERTRLLYEEFISTIHPVSSPDSAEMVKLLENTFRAVNIGLVNEVAQMCHRLGVNTWEVIDAAATKPFGFMPFYPGPGLGGHCIPIDPLYLSWKLKALNYQARFIELAHAINTDMPQFVVRLIQDSLNEQGKPLKGARILLLGVAYKRDIDDCRESPALEIIDRLQDKGATIVYHDSWIPTVKVGETTLHSQPLDDLSGFDVGVITTDHTGVDYGDLVSRLPLVVDTRNATQGVQSNRDRIVLL
jgi:UDP-N-acetyl-D-glucosamine dehydrogenase